MIIDRTLEFLFTLSHEIEGVIIIDEPVGWDTTRFKLTRDKKYNSIPFEYSSTLQFYFANGEHDGGAEFILFVENKYGVDTSIQIEIEIAHHGGEFESFFVGKLNLEDLIESELFVECNIEQLDFFTTFNQRSDLKVSFLDNRSVDGHEVQEYTPYDLNLHSKVLVKRIEVERIESVNIGLIGESPYYLPSEQFHEFTVNFSASGFPNINRTGFITQPLTEYNDRTTYIQFDFTNPEIEELSEYWNVSGGMLITEPTEIYTALEGGSHNFNLGLNFNLVLQAIQTSTISPNLPCAYGTPALALLEFATFSCFFIIKDEFDVVKYSNEFLVVPNSISDCTTTLKEISVETTFSLNDYTLSANDKVFLYGAVNMGGTYERMLVNTKVAYGVGYTLNAGSFINISADTIGSSSVGPSLRIHDVFQNLINKLTNRDDSFYSEFFGYVGCPYHTYASKGCGADFVVLNGFNLRDFPLDERPLQLSFRDLYDSMDAIFGLSLSLETIGGVEKIRIEQLNYAYTKEAILTFDNISGLKRSISKDKFFTQIEVGYTTWQPEEINGLDEFASKRTYTTPLKTIGSPLLLQSKVIASGSIIEVTRRLQYNATATTDSKYDSELFIIALNNSDPTIAEKNENFGTVNNLLSPETAYNLRLSPVRNLLRNGNKINGSLLKYLGYDLKFQAGEGNFLVQSDLNGSCPGNFNNELLTENQNIPWAYADIGEVDPIWEPIIYQFDYPLSFSDFTILKNNKNKGILINGDIHPASYYELGFLVDMEYEPVKGIAKFQLLKASTLPFNYVPEGADTLLMQDGDDFIYEDGDLILL